MYLVIGFVAQIVGGTIGMAYGVTSNSLLLATGLGPAAASASSHLVAIVTFASNGFFHFKLGNVKKELIKRLLIPGVLGGVIGAYTVVSIPAKRLLPLIYIYLIIMGIVVIVKTLKKVDAEENTKHLIPLGFLGGLFDAIGGGGWGIVVTSGLISKGHKANLSIGTANVIRFFVTFAESIAFLLLIKTIHWDIILPLTIGGLIASPFGAILCKKIPVKPLAICVGALIIILSLTSLKALI
jgi:uncharacterized protein